MLPADLRQLSETIQKIYTLFAENETLTDAQLREMIGRSTGFTDQLDVLMQLGYVRYAAGQTREPWVYEFVPSAEVDDERARARAAGTREAQRDRIVAALRAHRQRGIRASDFTGPDVIDGGGPIPHFAQAMAHARRTHGTGGKIHSELRRGEPTYWLRGDDTGRGAKRKGGDPYAQREAEYGRQIKEVGELTNRAEWIKRRRDFLRLARAARRIEGSDYWDHVPEEELNMVYEEAEDLLEAVKRLVAVGGTRAQRRRRDKIAALGRVDGREGPERDAYLAKVREMEAKDVAE